jgi:hypothetical protein
VRPSPQGAFVSLPGGVGELAETLAAALKPGSIELSAPVTDSSPIGQLRGRDSCRVVHAKTVILAVPAYAAARLLQGFDTTLAGLCDGVPYASTATIAFGYRRDQIRSCHAWYRLRRSQGRAIAADGCDLGHFEMARTRPRCSRPAAGVHGRRTGTPTRSTSPTTRWCGASEEALREVMGIEGQPIFARPLPKDAPKPASTKSGTSNESLQSTNA